MDRGTILLSCRVDAPVGLDAAYDMYAVGLYDYCQWALNDNRLAEDAVHNALLAAAGRGLLPGAGEPAGAGPAEAEPLRAWIFAAARNECLRLAPFTRPVTPGEPVRTGGTRFGAVWNGPAHQRPSRAELWQLVRLRRALDQLPAADQEIAELAFRHGFGSAALAAILGRPLAKVRRAVTDIYARLAAECDEGVAATFAVPPFPHPPASLRRLVLDAAAVPARLAHLAERHGPYNRLGFPRARDRRRRVRPIAVVAIGAGAAVVLSAGLLAENRRDDALQTSARQARPAAPAPAEAAVAPPASALAAPPVLATPAARATAAPSAGLAAEPPPRRALTGTRPVARGMSTQIRFSYDLRSRTWSAIVTARVRGVDATRASVAVWWVDTHGMHRYLPPTTRTGRGAFRAEVTNLPYGPVACAQVTAVTADGSKLTGPVAGPGGFPYCGSKKLGERRDKARHSR